MERKKQKAENSNCSQTLPKGQRHQGASKRGRKERRLWEKKKTKQTMLPFSLFGKQNESLERHFQKTIMDDFRIWAKCPFKRWWILHTLPVIQKSSREMLISHFGVIFQSLESDGLAPLPPSVLSCHCNVGNIYFQQEIVINVFLSDRDYYLSVGVVRHQIIPAVWTKV